MPHTLCRLTGKEHRANRDRFRYLQERKMHCCSLLVNYRFFQLIAINETRNTHVDGTKGNVIFCGAPAQRGPRPEVYRSHTTHHSRCDSSGQGISLSQRPLPDNTHDTHKKQTSMSPEGFKPMIQGSKRPQNHALDRVATGIGCKDKWVSKLWTSFHKGGHVSTHKPCHKPRVFSHVNKIRVRTLCDYCSLSFWPGGLKELNRKPDRNCIIRNLVIRNKHSIFIKMTVKARFTCAARVSWDWTCEQWNARNNFRPRSQW
jgi:hypothetical protein